MSQFVYKKDLIKRVESLHGKFLVVRLDGEDIFDCSLAQIEQQIVFSGKPQLTISITKKAARNEKA